MSSQWRLNHVKGFQWRNGQKKKIENSLLTCTLDSVNPILIAISSRMKMSGELKEESLANEIQVNILSAMIVKLMNNEINV